MGPPPAENLREMTPTTDFKTGPERTTAPYDLSARCVSRRVLAEIFMVRSEAKARLAEEILTSSTSQFIPFSPRPQFTFKETDLKAKEAPSEERTVSVVR